MWSGRRDEEEESRPTRTLRAELISGSIYLPVKAGEARCLCEHFSPPIGCGTSVVEGWCGGLKNFVGVAWVWEASDEVAEIEGRSCSLSDTPTLFLWEGGRVVACVVLRENEVGRVD